MMRGTMFWYDLRTNKKWILTPIILLVAIFSVLLIGLGIYAKWLNPNKDNVDDQGRPQASVEQYTLGSIQLFGCLSQGQECQGYEDAKKDVPNMVDSRLTYPASNDGPGADNGDGSKTTSIENLTDQQYQAIGQAIIHDGALSPTSVSEQNVSKKGKDTTSFTTEATEDTPALTGTMKFTGEGNKTRLQSMTYQ